VFVNVYSARSAIDWPATIAPVAGDDGAKETTRSVPVGTTVDEPVVPVVPVEPPFNFALVKAPTFPVFGIPFAF